MSLISTVIDTKDAVNETRLAKQKAKAVGGNGNERGLTARRDLGSKAAQRARALVNDSFILKLLGPACTGLMA